MKELTAPGPGWKYFSGGIYEHKSGVRLDLMVGCARLPGLRYVSANEWPESVHAARMIKINGGNRKRGLMAWARRLVKA